MSVRTMLALAALAAGQALPAAIPLPAVEGPIARTDGSRPWNASDRRIVPLDLAAIGYVEEEYFLRGKANVYDWGADGHAVVRTADAPYVTRILIRRPADPKRFSGNVWVNPSNPTLQADMDGLWMCCSAYLARHGDIAVNVTIKPIAIRALKLADPVRYRRLDWANPLPADQRCAVSRNPAVDPPDVNYMADQEDGLVWDILTQVGALVRSKAKGAPLARYAVSKVYAYGYSQDAAYLRTYLNSFHDDAVRLTGAKSPYDGYLMIGSTRTVRINQCSYRAVETRAKGDGVPVITASTEMDYKSNFQGLPPAKAAWRPDSDAPGDLYRHYDIAGATHGGGFVFRAGPNEADMATIAPVAPQALGMTRKIAADAAAGKPVQEVQQYWLITAMMDNVDRWARGQGAPPPGQRITTDENGETQLDAFGNAASGLRGPWLTVPVATYALRGHSGPLDYASYRYEPFDAARLHSLYPSKADYVAKVRAATGEMVAKRLLLREDGDALIAEAEARELP